MTAIFNQFQKTAWLRALALLVLGLLIILYPQNVLRVAVLILAALIALMSIPPFMAGQSIKKQTGTYGIGTAGGLIILLIAILLAFFASSVLRFLPLVTGILLILYGIGVFFVSRSQQDAYKPEAKWPTLGYGAVLLIIGIVFAFDLFDTILFGFQIFGGTLIAMGLVECIGWFMYHQPKNAPASVPAKPERKKIEANKNDHQA